METATALLKDLILPHLKNDVNFRHQQPAEIFWTGFTEAFLDYENDPKPVFASVYRLELENPERFIKKLPEIHRSFTEELAEQYVLDNRSEAIERLHQNGDSLFRDNVSFFRELRNAATRLERRRMIKEMPVTYAALSGEIPDDSIQAAIKKKGREELRAKFKVWDEEMNEEVIEMSTEQYSFNKSAANYKPENKNKEEPFLVTKKVQPKSSNFSFKWLYAVAAVLLIGFFIWQPTQRTGPELFNSYAVNPEVLSKIEVEELLETQDAVVTRGQEFQLSGYTQRETERALEAISLFQKQEFSQAKSVLQELNPMGKNEKLLFFLAVSQLNSGEIDEAIQELEFLQGMSNYVYSEDVKFHLALGYLEQGNTRSARKLLKDIENSSGKYARNATKLLNEMRWF